MILDRRLRGGEDINNMKERLSRREIDLMLFYVMLSYHILSYLILYYLILSYLILSYLILSYRAEIQV